MPRKPITANPSQIMVEQLAALGVRYVFNNPGSREARFFDSLHAHSDIHGILALHEGSVTAMAGGYTQVKGDPAVMVVHLGAGSLPVVVITFAGDTGSFADKIALDLSHNFGLRHDCRHKDQQTDSTPYDSHSRCSCWCRLTFSVISTYPGLLDLLRCSRVLILLQPSNSAKRTVVLINMFL